MRLREDELLEHLVLLKAQDSVDDERRFAALERAKRRLEMQRNGVDPFQTPAEVEVRTDEEAAKIADSPLPDLPPEWAEWERQALDPTKDL